MLAPIQLRAPFNSVRTFMFLTIGILFTGDLTANAFINKNRFSDRFIVLDTIKLSRNRQLIEGRNATGQLILTKLIRGNVPKRITRYGPKRLFCNYMYLLRRWHLKVTQYNLETGCKSNERRYYGRNIWFDVEFHIRVRNFY